jgi:hypothetical protein
MKDCKSCEYCNGYDNSDGTPICEYKDDNGDEGYEICPYNDTAKTTEEEFTCTVHMGELEKYIAHTISNSIVSRIYTKVDAMLDGLVKKEYDEVIRKKTDSEIDARISEQITAFMSGTISVGGGWNKPERTLTRTEYLSETIAAELGKTFEIDVVKKEVVNSVKSEIDKRTTSLKQEINVGIKNTFDEVTRKTLAENVVNMLMCSDTYSRLSDGMTKLLK